MLEHVVQHGVTAFETVFGVQTRVVGAGGFEQSHEYGTFLHGELAGRFGEVGRCRRLDAVGVAAEVHRVGVHLQNLLLVVE